MKNNNPPQILNNNFNKYVTLFAFSSIILWFGFYLSIWFEKSVFGTIFGSLIVLISLIGAYVSFHRSQSWGFSKSYVGLSLIFVSLALLMWATGEVFYLIDSYIETPLAIYDFFFIFIDPFYLISVYFLSKAIGTFKNIWTNLNLILLPLIILILNYIVVTLLRNQDIFTAFLNLDIDTIYIIGSVFLSTYVVSILIFSKKLGGIYKSALFFILLGLLSQYLADNLYEIYSSEKANGSLSDLVFFVSISLITYGTLKLNPESLNEKRN